MTSSMFSHDYFNGTTSKRNSPASDSGQLSNPSPYTTQTQTPRSESGTSLAQQLLTLEDKLDQQTRELNINTINGKLFDRNEALEHQNRELRNEIRYLQEMLIKRMEHCKCQDYTSRSTVLSELRNITLSGPGREYSPSVRYTDVKGHENARYDNSLLRRENHMTSDRKMSYAETVRKPSLSMSDSDISSTLRDSPLPSNLRSVHLYAPSVQRKEGVPFPADSEKIVDTISLDSAGKAADPRVHCTVHPYLCWVGWSPAKPLSRQQLQSIFELSNDDDIVYMRNDYGFISFRNKGLMYKALTVNNQEVGEHGVIKVERARRNIWWDELPYNMS